MEGETSLSYWFSDWLIVCEHTLVSQWVWRAQRPIRGSPFSPSTQISGIELRSWACPQVSLTAEPSTFTTKPLAISGAGFGQGDISSDEPLMRELLILCSCLTYRELEVGGRSIRKRPDDYQRLYILSLRTKDSIHLISGYQCLAGDGPLSHAQLEFWDEWTTSQSSVSSPWSWKSGH